jgi:hypothetical protein
MSEFCSNPEANRLFYAWRQTREIRRIRRRTRALRFASSAQAPRHAGIFRSLQIIGKHYRLCGGERGTRTPEPLWASMGRISPEFAALFGSRKSIRAAENLFAWYSRLGVGSLVPFVRWRMRGLGVVELILRFGVRILCLPGRRRCAARSGMPEPYEAAFEVVLPPKSARSLVRRHLPLYLELGFASQLFFKLLARSRCRRLRAALVLLPGQLC